MNIRHHFCLVIAIGEEGVERICGLNWEMFLDNAIERFVGRTQYEVLSVAKGVLCINGDLHMFFEPDVL